MKTTASGVDGLLIKGKKETGFNESLSAFNKQRRKARNSENTKALDANTINLNINGSLKLVSGNGQSVDIITELRHPQILKEITQLIIKEMHSIQGGLNSNE